MRLIQLLSLATLLIALPAAPEQTPPQTSAQPSPRPPEVRSEPMPMMSSPAEARTVQALGCDAVNRRLADAWKPMDDRLAVLVKQMNEARPSEKVDRMAAVIDELVAQRRETREQNAAMVPQLMQHVLQHVQYGMMSGVAASVQVCPILKPPQDTPRRSE